MSLTRRSEGVKTRWNPSCVLLKGRKHLLTSRAAASSIWGACRAQNEFERPQIHLEDRFHGLRVRILTLYHSTWNGPSFSICAILHSQSHPTFFCWGWESTVCHPLAAHQHPRGTRKAISSERIREQRSTCGAARSWGGKQACRAGLGSPVTARGTILAVRRSHSRWGNTWFLFPKKVTSGKKDCFLQKGIKATLIKHCACLSALAPCASLIQRLQRWLWDRFHLWCHLDDLDRNTAGWYCRKLDNLLQQTCTQDAKQPQCTVLHHPHREWTKPLSGWHQAQCPALLTVSQLDPTLYTSSGVLVKGEQTKYNLGDPCFVQFIQLPLFSVQLKLSTTWSKGRGNQLT